MFLSQKKENLRGKVQEVKKNRKHLLFSQSVMSDSLHSHELQHTRLPCPSPTPGACSNSSVESVMPSNHLVPCHPLLLLPSIFLSIRVFSKESAPHIRWPKYWSFSIRPSNEYSELVSFRNDWFTLFVSKGFSSLQHHSSKASTLQSPTFLMVQFSHPNMITGKTIALTLQTFLGKVMSLVFNILSIFVIAFLPSSNQLNFMAAVTVNSDFGAAQNKVCHCFHLFGMK